MTDVDTREDEELRAVFLSLNGKTEDELLRLLGRFESGATEEGLLEGGRRFVDGNVRWLRNVVCPARSKFEEAESQREMGLLVVGMLSEALQAPAAASATEHYIKIGALAWLIVKISVKQFCADWSPGEHGN